ncbi:MAG: DUF4147 domain-containing protein, partial [Anaerolineae bacterium]|nr:DUF4147 domain-containing protein [Anaerolineae bacterium]
MNLDMDLHDIQTSALEAVEPGYAVAQVMNWSGHKLTIGSSSWSLDGINELIVISIGKAAVPMAEMAMKILNISPIRGCVVTKYNHARDHALPTTIEVIESGHPIPDEEGLKASNKVSSLLQTAKENDFVLLLLSGGGSALLP